MNHSCESKASPAVATCSAEQVMLCWPDPLGEADVIVLRHCYLLLLELIASFKALRPHILTPTVTHFLASHTPLDKRAADPAPRLFREYQECCARALWRTPASPGAEPQQLYRRPSPCTP